MDFRSTGTNVLWDPTQFFFPSVWVEQKESRINWKWRGKVREEYKVDSKQEKRQCHLEIVGLTAQQLKVHWTLGLLNLMRIQWTRFVFPPLPPPDHLLRGCAQSWPHTELNLDTIEKWEHWRERPEETKDMGKCYASSSRNLGAESVPWAVGTITGSPAGDQDFSRWYASWLKFGKAPYDKITLSFLNSRFASWLVMMKTLCCGSYSAIFVTVMRPPISFQSTTS